MRQTKPFTKQKDEITKLTQDIEWKNWYNARDKEISWMKLNNQRDTWSKPSNLMHET